MGGIPKITLSEAFAKRNSSKANFQGKKDRKCNQKYSDNDNLKFSIEILKFYPEDVAKMQKMSVEERIQYRRRLKEENRYIIVEQDKAR